LKNGKFNNLFFATFFLTHWLPWTERKEKKREEAIASGNTPE
jgi:hypothetical protein